MFEYYIEWKTITMLNSFNLLYLNALEDAYLPFYYFFFSFSHFFFFLFRSPSVASQELCLLEKYEFPEPSVLVGCDMGSIFKWNKELEFSFPFRPVISPRL